MQRTHSHQHNIILSMTWKEAVEALARQVSGWAEADGLATEQYEAIPGEPVLEVQSGTNRLYIEPAEFEEALPPFLVWMYAYPSLQRVQLVSQGDGIWMIHTSDGVPFNKELDPRSFQDYAADLGVG